MLYLQYAVINTQTQTPSYCSVAGGGGGCWNTVAISNNHLPTIIYQYSFSCMSICTYYRIVQLVQKKMKKMIGLIVQISWHNYNQ